MFKRSISLFILLNMTFSMAAPILHFDCNMPCCEVEKLTCCDKEKIIMESKACKMDMKKCEIGSLFIPILSGPFHQHKMKVNLDFQKILLMELYNLSFESNFNQVVLDYPPEPPVRFVLPLLL
jgi:hypothetical protein